MPTMRLVVDQHTSVQDLKKFMDQVGDDDKIRGKKEGGHYVLYASSKEKGKTGGLLNVIGQGRDKKRDMGMQAIRTILQNSSSLPRDTREGLITNILGQAPLTRKELRKEGLEYVVNRALGELDQRMGFDGKEFNQVQQLGKDGNGLVHHYRSEDGESIAIKRPKIEFNLQDDGAGGIHPDSRQRLEEVYDGMRQEIRLHERIAQGGHPNILPFKGEMTGPVGQPMLVMPLMTHGDGLHLCNGIGNSGLDEGQQRNVALTTLGDIGNSLKFLHDGVGVLHLDVKPENYLMNDEGRLQLMDFGTSMEGLDHGMRTYKVDNPVYVPPEVALQQDGIQRGDHQIYEQLTALRAEAAAMRRRGEVVPDELKGRIDDLQRQLQESKGNFEIRVSPKTDSWALGLVAFRLLVAPQNDEQKNPLFMEHESDIVDRLREYDSGGRNFLDQVKAWYPNDVDLHARIDNLGDQERALINGLLEAKPEHRLDVGTAMDSPLFQEQGVGSRETRQQMLRIGGQG